MNRLEIVLTMGLPSTLPSPQFGGEGGVEGSLRVNTMMRPLATDQKKMSLSVSACLLILLPSADLFLHVFFLDHFTDEIARAIVL